MSFKIPQKIEILSINLTKYVQDLYNKNYTILIKGMERHTMFMDWQTQYGKDHSPQTKLIYKLTQGLSKSQQDILIEANEI